MVKLFFTLCSIFFLNTIYAQDKTNNKNLVNPIFSKIEKTSLNYGFKMDGYWIWCGSVIKGEDGYYHMFASRWDKKYPFHPGWMIASEIVRAKSKTPEGPFIFEEVVLAARGAQYWDGRATHNPSITKFGNEYVLYYMGTTHPFNDPIPENLDLNSPETIVSRSNKRIGIATSKSINGPWKRLDSPILETKPNTFYSFLTSNPAPFINNDGSAYLIFKGRSYLKKFPYQSIQKIGIAKAKHYLDKYEVQNNEHTIFDSNSIGEVEDPYLWIDDNGFHLLVKDMGIKLSGEHHAGILLHSPDGIDWKLDNNPKAYSRTLKLLNNESITMGQLERPFILFENGKPRCLYFATMDGNGGFQNSTSSWNIAIPLNID